MPTYRLIEVQPEADAHPLNRRSALSIARRVVGGFVGRLVESHPVVVSSGFVATAVALWAGGALRVDLEGMTDLGLVSVLPVSAFVGLLVLGIGFAITIALEPIRRRLLAGYLVAFIVLIHGTPALLYGTLRYSWAWKHVGVVDYIQRFGTVDPNIGTLEVYHNWPGFFSLMAWITDAAGLDSALTYASWAPLFFNLALLAIVGSLFRSFTTDERAVAAGLWIFFLASWVGQDYFSPQALAYLLYLSVIALLLRVFLIRPLVSRRHTGPGRLSGIVHRWRRAMTSRVLDAGEAGPSSPSVRPSEASSIHFRRLRPVQRVAVFIALLAAMAVIASSHQLTPVMLSMALTALVGLGFIGPRLLPIVMAAFTVGWATAFAAPFLQANLGDLASVGDVAANVDGALINLQLVAPGQVLVSWAARLLTGVVALSAATAWLLRYRKGVVLSGLALLAALPVGLVAFSGYGDEILFRIYLFALPFAALVTGIAIAASRAPSRWVLATTLVLTPMFLLAFYGNDRLYFFTESEVAAVESLYESAPDGALFIEGTRNYPSQFHNYEQFEYVPIAREPWPTRVRVAEDPVTVLGEWMSSGRHSAAYVLITRGQKSEVELLGNMPRGSLDTIERALLDSPEFTALLHTEDASIFVLTAAMDTTPPLANGGGR